MRKFKLFLLAFIAILALAFLANPQAKADSATVSTIDGASIRLTEPSGLRFIGQVTGSFTGTTVKYGFLLSKGDFTAAQMQELYAHSYAKAVEAGELDGEGKFYVSIVNIPATGYDDDICALAYVDVDGVKTYATTTCTRNIEEIISAIDPSERNDFMNRIMNTSTFNLNGGEFVYSKSFKIGAFNGGTGGKNGIIVGNINSIKTAVYWYKIAIKQSSINSKIYEIVDTAVSGKQFTTEDPYDYCIAAYESNSADYALLSSIGGNRSNYIYIDSLSANGTVNVDTNVEKLLGNKIYYTSGSQLPSIARDYYTFNGWYDNAGFAGDALTIHSGDNAKIYYAKFTPINYTLSYDLLGGSCNENTDDKTYNVESATITLPAAGTMSRNGYNFIEWNTRNDGTGDSISSIPSGSHGNITVYAIWSSIAPTGVELSSSDVRVLGLITPTKYVKSSFIAGDFIINGNTYSVGTELFASIDSAITASNAADIIYVFDGNYSTDFTLNKQLKLIGPNYNIAGDSLSRGTEANITGVVTITGAGTEFNGFNMGNSGRISIKASNVLVSCLLSTYNGAKGTDFIMLESTQSGTVVEKTKATLSSTARFVTCNSSSYTISNARVSNCTVTGYKYSKYQAGSSYVDGIKFQKISGTITINNNSLDGFDQFPVFLGTSGNTASRIDILDNHFTNGGNYLAVITIRGCANTTCTNIIGNTFELTRGKYVVDIRGTITDGNHLIAYNKFKDTINASIVTKYLANHENASALPYNVEHNYFATAPTSTTVQTSKEISNTFATTDELDEAYAAYLASN